MDIGIQRRGSGRSPANQKLKETNERVDCPVLTKDGLLCPAMFKMDDLNEVLQHLYSEHLDQRFSQSVYCSVCRVVGDYWKSEWLVEHVLAHNKASPPVTAKLVDRRYWEWDMIESLMSDNFTPEVIEKCRRIVFSWQLTSAIKQEMTGEQEFVEQTQVLVSNDSTDVWTSPLSPASQRPIDAASTQTRLGPVFGSSPQLRVGNISGSRLAQKSEDRQSLSLNDGPPSIGDDHDGAGYRTIFGQENVLNAHPSLDDDSPLSLSSNKNAVLTVISDAGRSAVDILSQSTFLDDSNSSLPTDTLASLSSGADWTPPPTQQVPPLRRRNRTLLPYPELPSMQYGGTPKRPRLDPPPLMPRPFDSRLSANRPQIASLLDISTPLPINPYQRQRQHFFFGDSTSRYNSQFHFPSSNAIDAPNAQWYQRNIRPSYLGSHQHRHQSHYQRFGGPALQAIGTRFSPYAQIMHNGWTVMTMVIPTSVFLDRMQRADPSFTPPPNLQLLPSNTFEN